MGITPNTVEETLFIPLWNRAQVSRKYPSLLYDPKAVELVEAIDYDFPAIDAQMNHEHRLANVARARQCDDVTRAYVTDHPRASVINLGAGLDTAFFRVDNGRIEWYDLDLPDVIAVRKQLLPETDRVHFIAKSLFDMSWCDDLRAIDDGVFAVAGGVLAYFDEAQLRTFFSALAERLPGAEMVFNAFSPGEVSRINRSLRRLGMRRVSMKWALEDASDLTTWDDRITVVDQFSCFRNVSYDPAWGTETIRKIQAIDEHRLMSIVHVSL